METKVKTKVLKDAENVPKYVREDLKEQIKALKKANNLYELGNIQSIEGTDEPYFRMRFGNYRLILYYEKEINTVKVLVLTHRKDTYKKQNMPWVK